MATAVDVECIACGFATPIPRTATEQLRDEIAMAALTGILANTFGYRGIEGCEARCRMAYEYADEMLRARGR